MTFWLPPLREAKLSSNKAKPGDSDYGVKPLTKADTQPGGRFDNSKHPRGGKGSKQGGKFVKAGDHGDMVSTVQRQLGLNPTGTFDAGMAASIVAFQRKHGLQVDGVVGRQTALALTGQFGRARRAGPGALGDYTKKLVGADSKPKAKKKAGRAGRPAAQRIRGGALLASDDETEGSPSPGEVVHLSGTALREDVIDVHGYVHDALGKFANKFGSHAKGGGAQKVIPEYDPKGLTFGKSAGGSNGARIATHRDGSKWLVKAYKGNENRVATELLSNAIYREMGAQVPRAGTIKLHNGKRALSYPLLEGKPKPHVFQKKGGRPSPELGQHFMTDALLANWDVAGLEDDNILWGKDGTPFRVDQGGTLEYRAQGGSKDFGPIPYEVTTMLQPGGQSRRSSFVTGPGIVAQAKALHETLTPERIDKLVDAAGFTNAGQRERVRRALKGRVDWMGKFARGEVGMPEPPPQKKPQGLFESWWLEEAAIPHSWEEALHPRDGFGKFIKKIGGLPGGKAIQLDSKTTIKRDKDGSFRVVRSGGIIKGFKTPEDAARAAADRSAKSKDADSIGGNVSHKDFNAYMKSRGAEPGAVAGLGHQDFGGKKLNSNELAAEIERLGADIKAAKASGDKYEERRLPTLEARLKEAAAKFKVAAGTSSAPATSSAPGQPMDMITKIKNLAKVGIQLKDGESIPVNGGGELKKAGGKYHASFPGKPTKEFDSAIGAAKHALGQYTSQGVEVKAGGPPTEWGTAEAKQAKSVNDFEGLPTWAKVKHPTTGASYVKQPDGTFLTTGSDGVKFSAVSMATTGTGWQVQLPAGTKPDVASQLAGTLGGGGAKPGSPTRGKITSTVELEALPTGAKIKLGGKKTFEKTADKQWKVVADGGDGTLGATVASSSFTPAINLGSLEHTGAAKPKKSGKKISGPQDVSKLATSPATGAKIPPMIADLDLAPGDVIQKAKGGWKYTVVDPAAGLNGSYVKVQGPKGNFKHWPKYAKVGLVTKADKSEVTLKPKEATATTPPAAKPATATWSPAQIAGHLQPGGKWANMSALKDGAVFETPAGQIGVLKKNEDAYSGYLAAYDIKTGAKFEPHATNYAPHKASEDPVVMKAAADALAKVKTASAAPATGSVSSAAAAVKPQPQHHGPTSLHPTWSGALSGTSAQTHMHQQQPALAAQAKSAMKGYTNGSYGVINGGLRSGDLPASQAGTVSALDQAFHDAKPLDVDIITHRGAQLEDFHGTLAPGKVIQDLGYLSTSPTSPWQKDVMLHMRLKAGLKGALWVDNFSSHGGEKELVVKRGAVMHVLQVEQVGNVKHVYVDVYG